MSSPLSTIAAAVERGVVIAHGTTRAWAAAAIATIAGEGLTIAVVPDEAAARVLEGDLAAMAPGLRSATLAGIDVSPYAELSPDRGAVVGRLATLARLALG